MTREKRKPIGPLFLHFMQQQLCTKRYVETSSSKILFKLDRCVLNSKRYFRTTLRRDEFDNTCQVIALIFSSKTWNNKEKEYVIQGKFIQYVYRQVYKPPLFRHTLLCQDNQGYIMVLAFNCQAVEPFFWSQYWQRWLHWSLERHQKISWWILIWYYLETFTKRPTKWKNHSQRYSDHVKTTNFLTELIFTFVFLIRRTAWNPSYIFCVWYKWSW